MTVYDTWARGSTACTLETKTGAAHQKAGTGRRVGTKKQVTLCRPELVPEGQKKNNLSSCVSS